MSSSSVESKMAHFGETQRRDAWWVEILPIIVLMGGFSVYATLRALEGTNFSWGPYLSPFYSPLIDPHHFWWKFSPALLILAGPLGFRATCYYYRKALYRAFLLDPPACAVSESGKRNYKGETAFPFILQNVHRYFLYLAIIFLAFLWHDAYDGFFFVGRLGRQEFGVGVGSLILVANVTLLSCHTAWTWLSFLNDRHMRFAWASLISVGLTDFYIRSVAAGLIKDIRIL